MSLPHRRQWATALGRELTPADGTPSDELVQAEERLGINLPDAMVAFYLYAGAAPELQEHDRLRKPDELLVEQGFLVFMEENQRVVDWGIHLPVAITGDPEVWQRVNAEPRGWYPETITLSEFMVRRLAFIRELILSADAEATALPSQD